MLHLQGYQRMLLWLQKYDYMLIYKPEKEMTLADRLSRLPSNKENTNRTTSEYTTPNLYVQ